MNSSKSGWFLAFVYLQLPLFFAAESFAQSRATTVDGKQVLLNEDGTWTVAAASDVPTLRESLPNPNDQLFWWNNGYDRPVEVKFANYLEQKELANDRDVRKCMIETMVEAKFSLKNKLSYVPAEMTLMESNGRITCYHKFYGKNAYGAESEERHSNFVPGYDSQLPPPRSALQR